MSKTDSLKYKIKLKTSTLTLLIINLILCFVFIFLIAAEKTKQRNETYLLALVPRAVIDSAQEIIFTLPSDSTSSIFTQFKMIKENGNYFLKTDTGKYYIRTELTEKLFSILTEKQECSFITKDIRQYADYGLDSGTAANIRFVSASKEILSDVYLGKIDAIGNSRYVTANLRTAVLLIPNNIAPFLNIRPDFWLDLQIYKSLFKADSIQSLQRKNEIILRSEKNDSYFAEFEKTLSGLNFIDIFTNMPICNEATEYFSIVLGSKTKIEIAVTPLEHGDFIFSDSRSENAYILSAYSKQRLEERLLKIFSH